jgi:Uma2 family endonuclease
MSSVRSIDESLRNPTLGEPAWGLALLYPEQGGWTEEEYLALDTNHLIEFADGCLEFLPMPTKAHQWTAGFLYRLLFAAVADRGLGEVYHAPYRVRVPERFREPDVVCILSRNAGTAYQRYADAADLVVEVVSEDDPDRDRVTKRAEYAAAGIPEYWIADPRDKTLTIFSLDPGAAEYRDAGRYREGQTARSVLLEGLAADVTAAFASP